MGGFRELDKLGFCYINSSRDAREISRDFVTSKRRFKMESLTLLMTVPHVPVLALSLAEHVIGS